jgi:selenocysteine-specific elongation factor
MRVIGTAGHVDHGKSTLVQALTGIDPDRLKEEKEREMTIDLGFAWLTLPSGQSVSIVDVPGHEAFIKNMLAGVGGIDAALLVIAADEGVMPQTREHLAILDLLEVQGGVVALTKIDLLPEREWIDLVSADIRKQIKDTVFAHAKIIPVSSKTREGIPDLLSELDRLVQVVAAKNDLGKPRLPIDRVFSMSGFGTVVTGTLIDGSFSVGDEIEITPGGKRGRIRGLQTHKEKRDRAIPGSRVAINLSGLSVDDLRRGQIAAHPGTLSATTLVDAQVQYLASAPKPLLHNGQVDFFSGSSEVSARVRLLDQPELKPGVNGWIQLHLSQPVALAKNDRFIIRFPSPSITVGGGVIVDPHSQARHRRFKRDVIARLETLAQGTPEELVVQFLTTRGANPADEKDIAFAADLKPEILRPILKTQIQAGGLVAVGSSGYLSPAGWQFLILKLGRALDEFHRAYPLRAGMPREEMKSRLGLPARTFDQVIEKAVEEKIIRANADVLLRPDFSIAFKPELQKKIETILSQFTQTPYAPPSAQEVEESIGAEALATLVAQDKLVRLNDSVVLSPQAFAAMRDGVIATIRSRGQITAAEVRDQYNTSRKYAIALLEYLDDKRITKRVGDARVLR